MNGVERYKEAINVTDVIMFMLGCDSQDYTQLIPTTTNHSFKNILSKDVEINSQCRNYFVLVNPFDQS